MRNSQSIRLAFFHMHQLGNVPALSHEAVQHACMPLTSLNEAEGIRLSLHEADKASNSEWPQFLSCKFGACENTNHDSVLTFDRRPRSGQDGSKFRYATRRKGLVLKLSIALSFKFHDQWSQNLLKARKHKPPRGYAHATAKQLEEADNMPKSA